MILVTSSLVGCIITLELLLLTTLHTLENFTHSLTTVACLEAKQNNAPPINTLGSGMCLLRFWRVCSLCVFMTILIQQIPMVIMSRLEPWNGKINDNHWKKFKILLWLSRLLDDNYYQFWLLPVIKSTQCTVLLIMIITIIE